MERVSRSPFRLRRVTNYRGAKLTMGYREEHFGIVQGFKEGSKCREREVSRRFEDKQAWENTEIGNKGQKRIIRNQVDQYTCLAMLCYLISTVHPVSSLNSISYYSSWVRGLCAYIHGAVNSSYWSWDPGATGPCVSAVPVTHWRGRSVSILAGHGCQCVITSPCQACLAGEQDKSLGRQVLKVQ